LTDCLNSHNQIEEVDLLKDRGFLVGDGVFETLRVEGGKLLWFNEHMARLKRHADNINLPLLQDKKAILKFLQERIPDEGLQRLRLTLTAGDGGRGYVRPSEMSPRIFASFFGAEPQDSLELLRFCPIPVPDKMSSKTISCMDRILKAPPLSDEWLMTRSDGCVTEATMANVFWLREGRIETPALNEALLAGLTRQRIIDMIKKMGLTCVEGDFHKDLLFEAEGIFLTGTVVGLLPVNQLEDKKINSLKSLATIKKAYQVLVDKELSLPQDSQ
jgi:branched-subunit amino acid aminotransferase/4-amino-4-deoxychorismate lyase